MQIIENDIQFAIKHRGVLNKDKIVYFIRSGKKEQGFFAAYRSVLELLYLADVCKMVPVIQLISVIVYQTEMVFLQVSRAQHLKTLLLKTLRLILTKVPKQKV